MKGLSSNQSFFRGELLNFGGVTLLETNISLVKDPFESMMVFLFHRWDMFVIRRVNVFVSFFESHSNWFKLNLDIFYFGDDLFFCEREGVSDSSFFGFGRYSKPGFAGVLGW